MGAKVGHSVSEETRKKIGDANRGERHGMYGKIPWNKGKKGYMGSNKTSFKKGMIPWNKGKHVGNHGNGFEKNHIPFNADKHKIEPLHDIYYCTICEKPLTKRQIANLLCRKRNNGKHPEAWFCSFKCANQYLGENHKGENHHNWQGGKSFEPYGENWKQIRRQIKERDNYQCQLCGKKGCRLDVHHIDYNKKNMSQDNLITLCHNCHMRTGFHREQWSALFKTLFLIRAIFYLGIKGKSKLVRNYKK